MITFKQFLLTERKDYDKVKLILKIYNKIEKMIIDGSIKEHMSLSKNIFEDTQYQYGGLTVFLHEIFPNLFDEAYLTFSDYGSHSKMKGDAAAFHHENEITLPFFGRIPVIYDENDKNKQIKQFNNLFNILRKNFKKRIAVEYFVHEFRHLLDYNEFPNQVLSQQNINEIETDEKYFNYIEEIDAYLTQAAFFLRNKAKKLEFKDFVDEFFKYFVEAFELDYKNILTLKNKKKVIKRLYDFWEKTRKQ